LAASANESVSAQLVPLWGKVLLGLFLITVGAVLVYCLIVLWPAVTEATTSNGTASTSSSAADTSDKLSSAADTSTKLKPISLFGVSYSPEADVALLLLVAVLSALGSYVHAATSFVDFAGNRRLVVSWIWWYPFRLFVGVALAEIFYFAIRAGFFGTDTPTEFVNPYGLAAVAGLVGLFSKQATDKLREVFETLFRTAPGYGDETRDDSLANPKPVLASVDPATLDINTQLLKITLRGEGFVRDSVVRVSYPSLEGGVPEPRETTYINSAELKVTLEPGDVADARSLSLSVVNPSPGGGSSDPVLLVVAQH
jgi:hypothetical protein